MAHDDAAPLRYRRALRSPPAPRIVWKEFAALEAVVSGGQTGADQGALRAARAIGLATGGFAPRGYRTLDGPAPWLGTEFGLVECWDAAYKSRTARNVFHSDATVRIASDFNSAGEICALKAIRRYKRPYLDVLYGDSSLRANLLAFLSRHRVGVLNVAGNSEATAPGIGAWVEAFLVEALSGK